MHTSLKIAPLAGTASGQDCLPLSLVKPDILSSLSWACLLSRVPVQRKHYHNFLVLGMQMRSHLPMQISHVPYTTWLINKQINHMAN